jgi:hypothetical protein
VEFHWKHPGTAHQVKAIDFTAILFRVVPGHHSLEVGVDVRGHSFSTPPFHVSESSLTNPLAFITPTHIIPQRRQVFLPFHSVLKFHPIDICFHFYSAYTSFSYVYFYFIFTSFLLLPCLTFYIQGLRISFTYSRVCPLAGLHSFS